MTIPVSGRWKKQGPGTIPSYVLNNVSGIKDWINGTLYETTYSYDKDSRQKTSSGGGLERGWTYDAYGRLVGITTEKDDQQFLEYGYHDSGDISVARETTTDSSGTQTYENHYTYDKP